jgi:hypothetical protein
MNRDLSTVNAVDEEEMDIWENLEQIYTRQKLLLALCNGDPRGPLYAIPDHPDVSQLQFEFDTLAQDFFALATKLPNRKYARAVEQLQAIFRQFKEML